VRRWLSENEEEPFFLWIHDMAVHDPYWASEEAQRSVNGRVIPRRRAIKLLRSAAAVNQGRSANVRPEDLRDLIALYDAEVRDADAFVGSVIECLKRRGWWDSCIFIVTSDHGDQLFEHGRFFHPASHHNELLRVPLLIRLPAQRGGQRVGGQVGLIDLVPTLADLLGTRLPDDACLGSSFASALRGRRDLAADSRLYVSESFYGLHGVAHRVDWHRVWRSNRRISYQNLRLKLMVDCHSSRCLAFDLRSDPGEIKDLTDGRSEPARIARALARLHVRRSERVRIRRTFPVVPPLVSA
jgi:arylsulfatase A-like enzyme